jgi:hypothetical protein
VYSSPKKRIPWYKPHKKFNPTIIFEGHKITDFPDLEEKINFKVGRIAIKKGEDDQFVSRISSWGVNRKQMWKSTLVDKMLKIDVI